MCLTKVLYLCLLLLWIQDSAALKLKSGNYLLFVCFSHIYIALSSGDHCFKRSHVEYLMREKC